MRRNHRAPCIISGRFVGIFVACALTLAATRVEAQTSLKLNENCIVSVLNRNTRVRPTERGCCRIFRRTSVWFVPAPPACSTA